MNIYKTVLPFLLLLNFSNLSYAESNDLARVEKIANLTLKSFSIKGLTSDENIQLISAIQDIPESELKNRSEINNLSMIQHMNDVLLKEIGEELSADEHQKLEPIFQKTLLAQFSIFETCQRTGEILQKTPNQFQVPLLCQVPTFNNNDIKSLQQNKKADLASFFEFMTDQIYTSAKEPFHTFLIIDKINNQLILNTENNQSFPGGIIQKLGKNITN